MTLDEPVPADWDFGCDPYESDLSSGRCVVEMSNIRNFVILFGEEPVQPPFAVRTDLKVDRGGDGQGSVTGSGPSAEPGQPGWSIDCGSDCDEELVPYQTRVRLTARPGTDSEFDRWTGPPCLSQQVCTFTVGKYPNVHAIFNEKAAAPQPPRERPDVELTKIADRSTASVGDTVSFHIEARIKNSGGAATNVVVTDTLPESVELVSTRANRGQGCTGSQTIRCDLDFLSGTLVATVDVVVRAKAAGEIVNTASASVQPSDPDTSNNTATARVIVAQPQGGGEESGVMRTGTARADVLIGTPHADVLTGLGGTTGCSGLVAPTGCSVAVGPHARWRSRPRCTRCRARERRDESPRPEPRYRAMWPGS